ncbi:3-deoxy-manno-octulosonate cytidylyltransferase [bacterium]|nr:3-deoxy-manno-octulosonate cytidylyltransferase [bacterium]
MKEFVIVIPARLKSSRLPRKPLAEISGKPMILHTYERANEATSANNIYIATDSNEILKLCDRVGVNCILTSEKCLTGTDRIAEFSKKIKAKIYINLQGDEPIMNKDNILKMIEAGCKNPDQIINGWASINNNREFISRNIPKVVIKDNGNLMYMSRSPIPGNKLDQFVEAKKQICVYSFPKKALDFLLENPQKSSTESIEDIEILRFLELGWDIKMIELTGESIAVDTPKDLKLVRQIMRSKS